MVPMNNKEGLKKADFSVVMPVYNEAGVIKKVIKNYYTIVIEKNPDSKLIIVEDGSDDGTKEILEKLNQTTPFTLVSRRDN